MNKKQKDMAKVNMRLTLVIWLVMCTVSMALMLVCSANKTIVIADAAQEGGEMETEEAFEKPIIRTRELTLEQIRDNQGRFYIALPANVKAENITMENRYWSGELHIHIKGDTEVFFENCAIAGDVSTIKRGICEMQTDGVLLKIEMECLLEYRSTMEENQLALAFYEPKELYQTIVLLDPVGGGADMGLTTEIDPLVNGTAALHEKDVTLEVARLVQKKLSLDGVKVYLTRAEDVDLSEEERLLFVEESEADFYIRIGVDEDLEMRERYGISCRYNEQYFIPDFGNVQLADIMTKEVTISSSNKAVGLVKAEEDSILRQIKIPAVELSLGYFSNTKESELLGQESYREKLADGIVQGIVKACEKRTESGE